MIFVEKTSFWEYTILNFTWKMHFDLKFPRHILLLEHRRREQKCPWRFSASLEVIIYYIHSFVWGCTSWFVFVFCFTILVRLCEERRTQRRHFTSLCGKKTRERKIRKQRMHLQDIIVYSSLSRDAKKISTDESLPSLEGHVTKK